jgi:simple sugar transport system permease protein
VTRRGQIGLAAFAVFAIAIVIWRTQSTAVAAIVSTGLFVGAFQYATPLTFGALGGLFSERSGVVNIGLEGMMLMGCFWGVVVSQKAGSWEIGLLGAMAAGGFLGLIHAVLSIHLRANQVISGTAVNILGLGITSYGTNAIFGSGGSGDVPRIPSVLHFLGKVPLIGDVIGGLNLMIYLAVVLVAVSWWFLFRTAWGLRLRAVGEHPRAADTVGIPVFRIRYAAVTLSGVLAGMGGAYLAFGLGSQFSENMTAGRGFIALAALIFGKWKPWGLLGAALLFGFSQALGDALQTIEHVNAFLVFNLPYVFTLIALVGVIGRSRGPAAAGIPYARQ